MQNFTELFKVVAKLQAIENSHLSDHEALQRCYDVALWREVTRSEVSINLMNRAHNRGEIVNCFQIHDCLDVCCQTTVIMLYFYLSYFHMCNAIKEYFQETFATLLPRKIIEVRPSSLKHQLLNFLVVLRSDNFAVINLMDPFKNDIEKMYHPL